MRIASPAGRTAPGPSSNRRRPRRGAPAGGAGEGCTGEAALTDQFDFSSLYGEYRDEARQQLAALDDALLRLEQGEALNETTQQTLLRLLHTLKGNSAMLGLTAAVDAVHALEAVFRDPPEWTQALLDTLFGVAAALRRVVDQVGTPEQDAALERLRALDLAEVERARPAGHSAPGPSAASDVAGEDAPAEAADADPGQELVRVSFAQLDALLHRVGELIRIGAELDVLVERHREALHSIGLRRALRERVEALEHTSGLLHDLTRELRLVPVRRIFSRFPRVARELAREQGKQVRVAIEGGEVELDKSTVDALADPLLHLVRNAVDHGAERPEEREARGRPAAATITLRAERHGDRVRIEVRDDGAGLDLARILGRARALGLVPPEATPTEEEVRELIFAPGFSSRAEATAVSGRGIGLDVVRQRVAELRGALSVVEVPGGGTRFTLELPLTLAVVPALVFESDGEVLALPAADVEETLREVTAERAGGARVVRHRGELVPLARPARLFGWSEEPAPERRRFAIVLRRGRRSVAIPADRLLDQREMVVKPLPPLLGRVPGVSGVTVTPAGGVVLLLDAAGLLELNLDHYRRGSHVHDGR